MGFQNDRKSLYNDFIKYISLNILSMLGVSAYVLADTYFISTYIGMEALAGLNLALPFFCLVNAIGMMIGIGTSIRYSILRGEKKKNKAVDVLIHGLIASVVVSLLVGFIGYTSSKGLMVLMGADKKLFPYSYCYVSTIFLFSITIILNCFGICMLRAAGHPKFAMTAALINSISNIFLDYVLICWLDDGIWGAALASGIAPGIALAFQVWIFSFHLGNFEFEIPEFDFEKIQDLFKLGFPSFITEFSAGFIMIFFNVVVLHHAGNPGVASYAIIANIAIVVGAIFTGIAQGIQPLISYYHGAREPMILDDITKWAYIITAIISAGLYFTLFEYSAHIVDLFCLNNSQKLVANDDFFLQQFTSGHAGEFIAMTELGIKIFFAGMFFWGANIVTTQVLASREDNQKSFNLSIARGGIVTIPVLFVLSWIWGVNGIWATIPVAELITLLAFL